MDSWRLRPLDTVWNCSDWRPGWPVVVGRVDRCQESLASLEGAPSLGGWLGRAEKRGLPVSQGGVLLQGLCGKRWQLLQVSPHHFIAARQGQTVGMAETRLAQEKTTAPHQETRLPPSGPHTPHLCSFSEKWCFPCTDLLKRAQGDTACRAGGPSSWCTRQGRVESSGMPAGSVQALHARRVQMSVPGQQGCGRGSSVSPVGGLRELLGAHSWALRMELFSTDFTVNCFPH